MRAVVTYTAEEIVAYARRHSPFYRDLYQHVGKPQRLDELPIVCQTDFWAAYRSGNLLTGAFEDGVVFKSGGTTGNPKFSVYTQKEWDSFTTAFGCRMATHGGVCDGDRVANIFYAGELYASFLFIMRSLDHAPVKTVHFPIAGSTAVADMVATIREFDINVIAGVPTSILSLASYLIETGVMLPSVERILYGGEALFADQLKAINEAIPTAECRSIGWASVDGGLLGYFGDGCENGEHRVFGDCTILEIVEEGSGKLIEKPGKAGKLLLTNLTRKLMPIIRYPVGDCGYWSEEKGRLDRKVCLTGRSEEGARIGPATIYLEDVRAVLAGFSHRIPASGFQIITSHHDGLDELHIRVGVAGNPETYSSETNSLKKVFYQERKMLSDLLDKNAIHPIKVSVVAVNQLRRNPRTGKLLQLIDLRSVEENAR